MNGFDSPVVFWILVATQFLGILSACMARFNEGSPRQGMSHGVFLGVLPIMGGLTMAALAVGPGCWLACATTLAVMVLTATCDMRNRREAATW